MRRALLGGAIAAFVACSLPSTDDYSRAPVTPDADPAPIEVVADAAPDVTLPADASFVDAGGDAGRSLTELLPIADSTFDDGTCGPDTGGYQSAVTGSMPAHTGAGACAVCRTDTSAGGLYTLDTGVPVKPRTGETYVAMAWVRRLPGSSDTTLIGMTLRSHSDDFNNVFNQANSPQVALSDDYQLLSLTMPITQNAPQMDVFVGSTPPVDESPACFLIDDLFVARQN